jgi:hypothetical protein
MNKLVFAFFLTFQLSYAANSFAQGYGRPLGSSSGESYGRPQKIETTEESRQRHSSENYQVYKSNQNQAPLGGYNERLGDTAPYGTERPGMAPKGYDYQSSRKRGSE